MPSKTKTDETLPVPEIDWERVDAEILAAEKSAFIPDFDFADAKDLVRVLADRFLARDLATYRVSAIELPFSNPLSRGVCDVYAEADATAIDWKTRVTGSLDVEWQNRQIDSWQWRITAAALGLRKFVYRGVSRLEHKVREIEIEVPEGNTQRVMQFLNGLFKSRAVLADFAIWPQNRPYACRAYNRICEFDADCRDGTEPEGLVYMKPFSYSGATTFMLCPEKFRRGHMVSAERSESEETAFGNLVHAGTAEVYRQAFGLQKLEVKL